MKDANMAWFGFWIFLSVYLLCDTFLFYKGYESTFWIAKTDVEKAIHTKAANE